MYYLKYFVFITFILTYITEKTYKILIYNNKIIKNGIITKMAIIGKLNIL